MSDPIALELRGISKTFGSVRALAGASLAVRRGTVHALLGENGAGKTTLMRVAFGMVRPDEGEIAIGGRAARLRSPRDAITRGIGMVHQHFSNVPALTVAENVAIGDRGIWNRTRAAERVRALGAKVGLSLPPDARVSDLSVGAQQRLEIIKALAHGAHVLIMDEPTAVLAPTEADDLLRWVRGFAASGNTVVIITHKLREASNVADEVTVLRAGRTVLAVRAAEATEDALAAAILGQAVFPDLKPLDEHNAGRANGPIVIAAHEVAVADSRGAVRIRDATFAVRGGEIVGVAALEGSGYEALLLAVGGRVPIRAGALTTPPAVGFVPDDRQRDALILDFSLVENFALSSAGTRRGIVRWAVWREATEALIEAYGIRVPGPLAKARELSGGNQQRFVLGRELMVASQALVASNPTRGLDIRATAAVHERLRATRDAGLAIILYSSDIDEVLSLADRVLTVHAGTVRECARDRVAVSRAMLGLS